MAGPAGCRCRLRSRIGLEQVHVLDTDVVAAAGAILTSDFMSAQVFVLLYGEDCVDVKSSQRRRLLFQLRVSWFASMWLPCLLSKSCFYLEPSIQRSPPCLRLLLPTARKDPSFSKVHQFLCPKVRFTSLRFLSTSLDILTIKAMTRLSPLSVVSLIAYYAHFTTRVSSIHGALF